MQEFNTGLYHWFCHLKSMARRKNDIVSRTSVIGIMGATGNVTGEHLHYEIRNKSNKYGDDINPCKHLGIPNVVGVYESENFQLKEIPDLEYKVHIQEKGWQESKVNGEVAGTKGECLRIEAIVINAEVPIEYMGHIQDVGDTAFVKNGEMLGTVGEGKRLEEIVIRCNSHKIKASAHIEGLGDVYYIEGNEVKIGTRGRALRLEALTLQFV